MAKFNNAYRVTEETFDSLASYRCDPASSLKWTCLFVLPGWLKAWWHSFGDGWDLFLCAVRDGNEILGIAPLRKRGEEACFIGDTDVCDYLDFIVTPGRGQTFFEVLVSHLRQQGIKTLDLRPLRNDSTALTDFIGKAESLGCEAYCKKEDVTLELELPGSWDAFLQKLSGKQRHEVRRKLRRLNEAGKINYRVIDDIETIGDGMRTFLHLFRSNRPDKAAFMTDQMASFFGSLANALAEAKILKLFFLDLDEIPASAIMCFDYDSTRYLYNSGYDRRFGTLSVGLMSKVLSIKDSIRNGSKKYDFLKGAEVYKHQLGGEAVPLYGCRLKLR